MITNDEHAAIAFEHLLSFIVAVEFGESRLSVLRLRDLLSLTIVTCNDAPTSRFLIAALAFVHLMNRN
jgi:hypothetical protein